MTCRCWNVARDGHQADCEIGRELRRQRAFEAAVAGRLIDEVRRTEPLVPVIDLLGWAPGEITEAYGS